MYSSGRVTVNSATRVTVKLDSPVTRVAHGRVYSPCDSATAGNYATLVTMPSSCIVTTLAEFTVPVTLPLLVTKQSSCMASMLANID